MLLPSPAPNFILKMNYLLFWVCEFETWLMNEHIIVKKEKKKEKKTDILVLSLLDFATLHKLSISRIHLIVQAFVLILLLSQFYGKKRY